MKRWVPDARACMNVNRLCRLRLQAIVSAVHRDVWAMPILRLAGGARYESRALSCPQPVGDKRWGDVGLRWTSAWAR